MRSVYVYSSAVTVNAHEYLNCEFTVDDSVYYISATDSLVLWVNSTCTVCANSIRKDTGSGPFQLAVYIPFGAVRSKIDLSDSYKKPVGTPVLASHKPCSTTDCTLPPLAMESPRIL